MHILLLVNICINH